jgi:hypothetical protein
LIAGESFELFKGRASRGPFFGALLKPDTGVGFARLEKIYEYHIRMGTWRFGNRFDLGGHFAFVRCQENSRIGPRVGPWHQGIQEGDA